MNDRAGRPPIPKQGRVVVLQRKRLPNQRSAPIPQIVGHISPKALTYADVLRGKPVAHHGGQNLVKIGEDAQNVWRDCSRGIFRGFGRHGGLVAGLMDAFTLQKLPSNQLFLGFYHKYLACFLIFC